MSTSPEPSQRADDQLVTHLSHWLTRQLGNDVLYGGRGDDRLDGGPGRDRLFGGPGNDMLRARDGARDVVDCGPGRDTAVIDRFDRVSGCETVRRF